PCGGVREGGFCEIDHLMKCVWVDAWTGVKKIGEEETFTIPLRPAETNQQGRSAWAKVIEKNKDTDELYRVKIFPPVPLEVGTHRSPSGFLEEKLQAGDFVITAELSPPDSADPAEIIRRVAHLKDFVTAVNVPDGAGANCHMSSLASSVILHNDGVVPVMQYACRDRNRIALQGDILGAAALGVTNLLCVTGDSVQSGDQKGAKPVFDLDSISLLRTAKMMRDEDIFLSGRQLKKAPNLFLGAALNPFVSPLDARVLRMERKINAGAQFFQTQFCFDVAALKKFMTEVRARELHKKCYILVGVGPLVSVKAARFIKSSVPGVIIPDHIIERLERAGDERQEGKRICMETLNQIRQIEGISGVHLMSYRKERLLAEIISESGLV
ncbi:MAG TPA: hypothetical protein ENI91_08175, partial [Sphingomonadales bacterium]|nr:hypothetical protein [Sphingomonadales bacterium]